MHTLPINRPINRERLSRETKMKEPLTKEELNKIELLELELKQLSDNDRNLWGKKEQRRYMRILSKINIIRNRSAMSTVNRTLFISSFILWITASILFKSHAVTELIATIIAALGTALGVWGILRHSNQT